MYGYVECIIAKRVDDKVLAARFYGGTINRDMPMPATFTTKNEKLQRLVEESKEFKQGLITVTYTEEEPEEKTAVKNVVKDIANFQSARSYLINNYSVPLEKVQTKAMVLAVAKEMGIEFPNI